MLQHGHRAGLVVDLDVHHAGGVGDRVVGVAHAGVGVGHRIGLEVHAGAGDQLAEAPGGRRRDLADRHPLVGRALHVDHAVLDVEVGGVDLHRLTGDLEHLLLGLLGGLEHREPADEGAARGEGAGAERRGVGVRDVHVDRLVGHAERVGHDLRVHGLGALAEVDGAGEDVDAPVGLDLDPGLRRVAALVHAGGVLDRGEAASTMLHRAASWGSPSFASASWSTRCGGSHSPERSSFLMSR